MHLDDFAIPDTAAARAAREFSAEFHSPALFNHCVRSWLWASALAVAEGRAEPDAELLYVAALLHDIGLVGAFDNHRLAFEDAGGYVAMALTAGAGWPKDRRRRVHEVIYRHMQPAVDPAEDLEGHLLEVATGIDISGGRADELPAGLRREVLAAHPRLTLAGEFADCLHDQARRKPGSAAARLAADASAEALARRFATNPLERPAE